MKFTIVNEVPEKKASRKDLQKFLDIFEKSEGVIARVDITEHHYKSPRIAYNCLWSAAKRSRRNIKVVLRGNDVYLVKVQPED